MAFAAAGERNRHADDRHHRQRRAAARVAIELGEHDAGDADAAVELAGALDRVLPGHRVGDVEQVRRLHGVLDRLQLDHQVVVDVQPAGGVDDDGVVALGPGLGQRARWRAPPGPSCPARYTFTPACSPTISSCWMAAGRRTSVDTITGLLALTLQPAPELARRGRLARTLQAEQQHDARLRRVLRQAALGAGKERQQLVADDLHAPAAPATGCAAPPGPSPGRGRGR